MWTRRQLLTNGSLGLLAGAAAGTAYAVSGDNRDATDGRDAEIPDGSASKGMITPEADRAIASGLAYLSKNQNPFNGAFGTGGYTGNVAVTSLAALAFMSGGHQPNRGKYGEVVTKALKFVLSMENRDGSTPGYLYNRNGTAHGPMYGHGFGTLFLAEVSGMVHEKGLREELQSKLHRAVDLIRRSQRRGGGWRYTPHSTEADISVTICQIMALRAARNAGIAVPKSDVDRCVEYVKRCRDAREGFFRYMAEGNGGGGPPFARTAAGVCALYSAGIYQGEEITKGLNYLMRFIPARGHGFAGIERDIQYFYGHYYAVQAMWTAGGDYWKRWFPAIRDELIDRQLHSGALDGCWQDQICNHYGTAMACIILQVPNNYLTILQK